MSNLVFQATGFMVPTHHVQWLMNQTDLLYEVFVERFISYGTNMDVLPTAQHLVQECDSDQEFLEAYTSVMMYDNATIYLDVIEDEEESMRFTNVLNDQISGIYHKDVEKILVMSHYTCADEDGVPLITPVRSVW